MKPKRLKQVGIAFDQLINAIAAGWADETISARAHRRSEDKVKWYRVKKFINTIFFWQEDHCRRAYESERERLHLAPEYRDSGINGANEGNRSTAD